MAMLFAGHVPIGPPPFLAAAPMSTAGSIADEHRGGRILRLEGVKKECRRMPEWRVAGVPSSKGPRLE